MIDYTDIDVRLEEYSEAFDFYMEHGKMPQSMPEEDCLAGYMKEVIDNNPQIDGSDSTWVEVLKDELISFFSVLLEHFRTLQLEAIKELKMISDFQGASIEQKREMWHEVCNTIKASYPEYDVNLHGYISQFKTQDREAIFSAMTDDWRRACNSKLAHDESQLLARSKTYFETYCKTACQTDYEKRRRISQYLIRYPLLKVIVNMIGREKDPSNHEIDNVAYRFMPIAVAKNNSVDEVDRIELGDSLERVLPLEYAIPEDLFYKKFVTKELLQFSNPGKDKPKKKESQQKSPRLTKGPIIVSIDTSGSMDGKPLRIAFALLKELLSIAKRQKRPCYLISFSVRSKAIDLAKPCNWSRIDDFFDNSFTGGTDGEKMFAAAIDVLQYNTYSMGDVLVISDFEFDLPCDSTMARIQKEKQLGTRFYGLCIGRFATIEYPIMVLDKMWTI